MKRIVILGSTGSIGTQALKAVSGLGPSYQIAGLSVRRDVEGLLKQVQAYKPKAVAVFDDDARAQALSRLPKGVELCSPGVEGLIELAAMDGADLVLTSLVGGVGLPPLVAAIKAGKKIALANKEPMVMAGHLLMEEARRWNAEIIPVDSEPSAIFQSLQGHPHGENQGKSLTALRASLAKQIRKVWLTASGGPFYRHEGPLSDVTPAQALAHPNWVMGKKITVDSATLMNKGFEAIEIANLFGLQMSQIEIMIHPQSILHSAVEFSDGSVVGQLGWPDMTLPIQYAITYPERGDILVEPFDFVRAGRLDFDKPDFERFRCLQLARDAARRGGTQPAILNAADEVAVESFLEEKIRFTDIPLLIERLMELGRASNAEQASLAEIVEADQWAREKAKGLVDAGLKAA